MARSLFVPFTPVLVVLLLCVILGVVADAGSGPPAAVNAAAAIAPAPSELSLLPTAVPLPWLPPDQPALESVAESWYAFSSGSGWCTASCLGLAAWQPLIPDLLLLEAAVVAYARFPQWRAVAQASAVANVAVSWGELPNAAAQFSASDNAITLDADLASEPVAVVAVILVHEIIHAVRLSRHSPLAVPRGWDAAVCFEEEMIASAWTAEAWRLLKLRPVTSPWSTSHDRLLQHRDAGRIQAWVLLSPGWQRQCLRDAPQPACSITAWVRDARGWQQDCLGTFMPSY